jgi:hypothetical protein
MSLGPPLVVAHTNDNVGRATYALFFDHFPVTWRYMRGMNYGTHLLVLLQAIEPLAATARKVWSHDWQDT